MDLTIQALQPVVPFVCHLPLALVQQALQQQTTLQPNVALTLQHAIVQQLQQEAGGTPCLLRWAIVSLDEPQQKALIEGVYW